MMNAWLLKLEKRIGEKLSEFTILAEAEKDGNKFVLSCRTEYYLEKNKDRLWTGIHPIIKGKRYGALWLGYIQRNADHNKFLNEKIKTWKFRDRTDEGYYCVQCKKFSEKSVMNWGISIYIDPDQSGTFMIVKDHYDGCRGWE